MLLSPLFWARLSSIISRKRPTIYNKKKKENFGLNLECVVAQNIHAFIYNVHPLRAAGESVNFNRVTVGIRLQYRERRSFFGLEELVARLV